MTATNHVLTGSVFAAATVTHWPLWVLLPAAFLLHFVLDSLPHYGQPDNPLAAISRLKWLLPLDMTIATAVLIVIAAQQPAHWLVILIGGIVCAAPDWWSLKRYLRFLRTGNPAWTEDWFAQFHHKIQWGERLWGAWIELAWFLGFGYLLLTKL